MHIQKLKRFAEKKTDIPNERSISIFQKPVLSKKQKAKSKKKKNNEIMHIQFRSIEFLQMCKNPLLYIYYCLLLNEYVNANYPTKRYL